MIDATLAINQLTNAANGINRLKIMIGAKDFTRDENSTSFKFKCKAKNKSNFCKITLNSKDLYNVEFGYIRAAKYTQRSIIENMYFDMLKEYFESETGLDLNLL